MSDQTARELLAQQQERLVQALVAGGETPAGLDPDQVAFAAQSLLSKRRRGVARSWPILHRSLGEQFETLFREYALGHPAPAHDPLADGRAFSAYLLESGRLPDAAQLELLAQRAQRGWPIRLARLTGSRSLHLAIRLPGLGIRLLRLRSLIRFPRQ